ncbi:MAG TPA: condensation domain-containing protein, partial [Polyangiaceae bacterium]|nr:condensation domain-containing protein [Polyangiaceae bacterium]
ARQFVQSGASATLQVLLADKAFSETRAAAPYLAYVAARPQRAEVPLVSSEAAAGIRAWLIDWLAGELSVSPSEVDVRRSFQSYGLDSVRLIALTGDLASFSARRIAATAAYDYPNVELLAEHAIAAPGLLAVPPLSRPGPLPLGARQLRLVALERAHPGEIIDHLTEVFTLEPVSEATVRSVLERLVERHEALRCHIIEGTAGPAQFAERVLEPFPLHVRDVPTDSGSFDEEVRRVALAQDRAPFELNGPLVRAALVRGAAGDRALVLTLHHLVGDGWSMALLRRDFTSLMKSALGQSADPLPTLGRQQADVAARERAFLQSTEASASLAFWSARLGDHPRLRATLPGTTFHGAVERRSLPKETMERLARVAHRLGVTPYIALLTAFCRVLGRESGEDDVLVNTHLFNRSDEDERSLCGYLVNVLTVRTALTSAMPFSEAARSVHVAWMEALEHALPIDEVVRTLRPEAYAERYMPSASAFNMLPALPEGAASGSGPVAPRPDLAPPPGFMFFERMLLVAPDPSGNQWLTLWFNEATVDPPAAAKFLEVLVLDLDAISADNPPASTRVSVCDRGDVVRGAARRFVSERLGVEAWAVSDDVALTRLGLDSVLAAELASALEDALGSPVDASVVFRHRSIDGIARALSVEPVPAKRVPSGEPGPLSCTELGLFQLFTRDPGPQDPYNLLLTLRIDAPPDAVRLRQALSLLGARHEALRTGFYVGNDGVPRRRVLESVEPPFAVVRVSPAELATARRAQGDALRRV